MTAQAGATTKEIMGRLGHSTVASTMRCQHVADERSADVARKNDDLL